MNKKIKHNKKSTPEENEILNITSEECAEVIQSISKIFRFGWDSCHPDNPFCTNKDHFEEELGDLLCMIRILDQKKIIDMAKIETAMYNKYIKLKKYTDIDLKDISYDM